MTANIGTTVRRSTPIGLTWEWVSPLPSVRTISRCNLETSNSARGSLGERN
jgi:hypothetical protein